MSPTSSRSCDRYRASRSEAGNILILTVLAMVVVLGIVALAIDGSYMYTERNRMAAAADAAAKSAALELKRGSGDLQAFANREVVAHGFTPAPDGDADVVVTTPPDDGAFAGQPKFVKVVVSRTTATFFARVLGWANLRPGARAVAGTSQPEYCFITMDDLNVGNDTWTLNGCNVGVGGDLNVLPSGVVIQGSPTPFVGVSGTCTGPCSQAGSLSTGAPAPIDPMAGLAAPTVSGPCGPAPVTNPLPGGCYTTIPTGVTTLQSGATFKVTGLWRPDSVTGSNVLIYLTSTAEIDGGNNGSLNLVAGNTAPYAGIAIYGDPGSTLGATNHFTLNITGAIYMPGGTGDFKNHLEITDTGCSLFIFNTFTEKNGNAKVFKTTGCAGQFSNAAFLGVALAE